MVTIKKIDIKDFVCNSKNRNSQFFENETQTEVNKMLLCYGQVFQLDLKELLGKLENKQNNAHDIHNYFYNKVGKGFSAIDINANSLMVKIPTIQEYANLKAIRKEKAQAKKQKAQAKQQKAQA